MDYPRSLAAALDLVDDRFTDGDPGNSVPPSVIPAEAWANPITDEILNVITGAGDVPDEETVDQLYNAIVAIIDTMTPPASEGADGMAEIATQAETDAGTDDATIVTPLKLHTLFSGNQTLAANGYQILPGGLILQWCSVTHGALSNGASVNVTWPLAFPNAILNAVMSDTHGYTQPSLEGAQITSLSTTGAVVNSGWESRDAGMSPFRFFAIGH